MNDSVHASAPTVRRLPVLPIAAGLLAALVVLLGTSEFAAIHRQRGERDALRAKAENFRSQIRAAQKRTQDSTERTKAARVELGRLAAVARSDAELDSEVDAWLGRAARLRDAAQRPGLTLPEVALLNDDDWFDLARDAEVGTDEQLQKAFEKVRQKARSRAGLAVRRALMRYADAHDGTLPATVQELAPYVNPPLPAGILDRYRMSAQGPLTSIGSKDWLLMEEGEFANRDSSRLVVTRSGYYTPGFDEISNADLRAAVAAYARQHQGNQPTAPSELMPYFTQPPHPDAAKTLLQKSAADFAAELRKAHGDE